MTNVLLPTSNERAVQIAGRCLRLAGCSCRNGYASSRWLKTPYDLAHTDPLHAFASFQSWLKDFMEANPDVLIFPINEGVVSACLGLSGDPEIKDRIVSFSPKSCRFSLSKVVATEAARQAGLDIPGTIVLRFPEQEANLVISQNLTFPCLLKWDNYESGNCYHKGGNRVVFDSKSLKGLLAELNAFRCGVMIQKLVPGYGCGVFFLRHQGKILLKFAHTRRHEVPWSGGVSAYCESSDDAEVLAAGKKLLDAIDYEGVAMVEFRKEPGKPPVFLEINGRLWGSLGLAIAAGANFPVAMVECHLDGRTSVKQPDLSRRVRWHDPGLEMDYLRSLWTKEPGPIDGPAPRWRGTLQVAANFLDPRVKSDWWRWDDLPGSAKRYLRLARREAAWLKSVLRRRFMGDKPPPLVSQAEVRTRYWAENPSLPGSILFVCYGNICRSPYAEHRWNEWERESEEVLPTAKSSGFYDKEGRETPARFQGAARYRGVELGGHRSRRMDAKQVKEADLIVAMDHRNLKDLHREFPEAMDKVLLLGAVQTGEDPEIPDPYEQEIGAGAVAYTRIDAALEVLRGVMESMR